MEGVRCARAVLRGLGERIDDLQLLDRRARPPVRDDQRQRVLVLGANVDEVDVDPVDLGDEVREGRKALLELAPVVVRRPVVGQRLDRLELHALGGIHLPVGPLRRLDAAAQVLELLLGDVDRELRGCSAARRAADSVEAVASMRLACNLLIQWGISQGRGRPLVLLERSHGETGALELLPVELRRLARPGPDRGLAAVVDLVRDSGSRDRGSPRGSRWRGCGRRDRRCCGRR